MEERHRAPRVLIEDSDGASAWATRRALERAGYDVQACDGPVAFRRGRCPLVHEGRCELAEGADVILFALGRDNGAVLDAERRLLPQIPVVIEGLPSDVEALGSPAEGLPTVSLISTGNQIVRAIEGALSR